MKPFTGILLTVVLLLAGCATTPATVRAAPSDSGYYHDRYYPRHHYGFRYGHRYHPHHRRYFPRYQHGFRYGHRYHPRYHFRFRH
jgi:hypothetical protein